MGLLSADVDLQYLGQWVYLLALPNISDMLVIFHDLGHLIVKTQSAYFSNVSDVPVAYFTRYLLLTYCNS